MSSMLDIVPRHLRIASEHEFSAMSETVTRHDNAKQAQDYDALIGTFQRDAICEFRPAGLRITSLQTLDTLYRRTLPKLSYSLLNRRKTRQWSNQTGLVREWLYPVHSSSGEERYTRQLEIFEFVDGYRFIGSYRARMNFIYSDLFVEALGNDFASLPGVERVPG